MATNLKKVPLRRTIAALGLLSAWVIPTAASAQTSQQAQYEIWFLTNMTDHHATAVQLAGMAPQRTSNPEILAMSESVISNRLPEIQTMQAWLSNWYGVNYSPRVNNGWTNGARGIVGDAYDDSLVNALISLNTRSVSEAQRAMNFAFHPELAEAARSIIDIQGGELNMLYTWTPANAVPTGPFNSQRRITSFNTFPMGTGVPTGPFDNRRRLTSINPFPMGTGVPTGPFDTRRRLSSFNPFPMGTGVPTGPFDSNRRLTNLSPNSGSGVPSGPFGTARRLQ